MQETPSLDATQVAEFLQRNPDFFETHSEVFANLVVPHPYASRAISLGERQVLTLRERTRTLERKLATLTAHARDNQRIVAALHRWSVRLLCTTQATQLPDVVTEGLREEFSVPAAALRLWHLADSPDAAWAQRVSDDLVAFADALARPYCGTPPDIEAVNWFSAAPASVALVALHADHGAPRTFGLLALGSSDPGRFRADMDTDFLQQIGGLASAALQRLTTIPVN